MMYHRKLLQEWYWDKNEELAELLGEDFPRQWNAKPVISDVRMEDRRANMRDTTTRVSRKRVNGNRKANKKENGGGGGGGEEKSGGGNRKEVKR